MKVTKVANFGNIPAGTQVWLTDDQARSRLHLVSEVETSKKVRDRKLYAANGQLGFKAGEELSIEGELDAGLEAMFGLTASAQATKEEGRNRVRAVQKAEAEIETRKDALAKAEEAERAETDAAKKAPLTEAVAAARAALEEARDRLKDLAD